MAKGMTMGPEQFEQIEQYILGSLGWRERSLMERRMKVDPDFRQEVKVIRILIEGIQRIGKTRDERFPAR